MPLPYMSTRTSRSFEALHFFPILAKKKTTRYESAVSPPPLVVGAARAQKPRKTKVMPQIEHTKGKLWTGGKREDGANNTKKGPGNQDHFFFGCCYNTNTIRIPRRARKRAHTHIHKQDSPRTIYRVGARPNRQRLK